MKKNIKTLSTLLCSLFLLCGGCVTAYGEVSLPSGTVAGLPEGLTALDEDGNVVNSATGEYFFHVEGMTLGETYTKDVEIINLREDKAYHVYFYSEPIFQKGEIDLENWCTETIYLEDEEVYTGKVTGEGSTDLTETPIDLGVFTPGQSRTLRAEVIWDTWGDAGGLVDYGKKLVDANGVTVLEEAEGDGYIYGETEFRWIFYAAVDETYVPPKTGLLSDSKTWYLLLGAIAAACVILAFALLYKKRKQNHE